MTELENGRPASTAKRRRLDSAGGMNHDAWPPSHTAGASSEDALLSPVGLHIESSSFHIPGITALASVANGAHSTTSPTAERAPAFDMHAAGGAASTGPPPPPLTPASSTYNSASFMQPHQHQPVSWVPGGFSPDILDPLLQPSAMPSPDDYANNPTFLASQEELRSLLFNTAQSNHPTRAPSPAANGANGGAGDIIDASTTNQMKRILASPKRIDYLKNYISKVAPWLDMFDMQRHFGVSVPALAQNQPPLLYAILALSARQMERKKGVRHAFESLELYQEAIRLLTPTLPERSPHILVTCVILCCLEMMSASPQDWRRHLEGCATLFDSFDVNGFSGGLLQAVFWCYVRMDLCGALISDGTESTLLAIRKWVPSDVSEDEIHDLFMSRRSPDMHANHAVYLCSKTCELLSDRTKYTELGVDNGCTGPVYAHRWKRLWSDLRRWHDERPHELLPVKTIRQKSNKPFPEILFVHWAAISSNQLYHTASILLLNSIPQSLKLDPLPVHNPLWHARRVCGISLSNPHEGCLNNACQPLWIAGRMLGHHSEHSAIIELIRNIEAQTGWGMYWRIRDLEEAWGYRSH